jgi:hypothetical protein
MGCSLLPHQSTILKQRDTRGLRTGCAQGYDLERPVGIANDAQQGLRVGAVGFTDNGNLSRLRKGIRQRLESLPKAQRYWAIIGWF